MRLNAAGLEASLRDPVDRRHLEMDWNKKASGGLLHSVHIELDRAEEVGVTQEGHRQVLGPGT